MHDPDLIVLTLTGKDGRRIATAVNWANHPETLGSRNTQISADYPGFFYKRLEAKVGGMAVLWNGAVGGMQSPLGAKIKDPDTGEAGAGEQLPQDADSGRAHRRSGGGCHRRGQRQCASIRWSSPNASSRIPVTNRGFEMAAQADLYKGRKKTTADGATTAPVGLIGCRAESRCSISRWCPARCIRS